MSEPTNTPITWQVVSQVDTVDRLPSGATGPGVDVTWQTSNGITGTVFVPMTEYRDVDKVAGILAADVAHRVTVGTIGGTV